MMNSFMKIAGKIGAQKHLVAIRDAFVAMLPLTMAGSVAVLLNVFFRDIPNNLGWTSFSEAMKPLIELNGYVYFGTIAVMALIFAFALGYNRAQHEKVNPIAGGLVAFGAFVATIPQTVKIITELAGVDKTVIEALKKLGLTLLQEGGKTNLETSQWGAITTAYAGATGLFTAVFIGLISSEIYCFLMNKKLILRCLKMCHLLLIKLLLLLSQGQLQFTYRLFLVIYQRYLRIFH